LARVALYFLLRKRQYTDYSKVVFSLSTENVTLRRANSAGSSFSGTQSPVKSRMTVTNSVPAARKIIHFRKLLSFSLITSFCCNGLQQKYTTGSR
jgi:hypothetical protein